MLCIADVLMCHYDRMDLYKEFLSKYMHMWIVYEDMLQVLIQTWKHLY